MKLFNPRRLAEIIREAPERQGITIRALARKMGGVSQNYLTRQLNPDDDGAKLGVEDFVYLLAVTDLKPLDYIERALGRVAVPEPEPAGTCRRTWHELLASSATEGGEAQGSLARALANDGRVDAGEAEEVIREVNEAIAILIEIRTMALAVLDSEFRDIDD